MSELISSEIGENKISEKIGDVKGLEAQIKESYKEIYETKEELKGLKTEIANDLTGERLKAVLEKELTTDHVKNVLNQAIAKFSDTKDGIHGFNDVYATMGAGLTFNMQLGLAKLGCTFDKGIDGIYGSQDTRKRVAEFQNAWNAAHTDQLIAVDGWAGKETLSKMVIALDDPSWDKTKVEHNSSVVYTEKTTTKEAKKSLTKEEAEKDPAANHLVKKEMAGVTFFVPEEGYEFIDKDGTKGNLAVKKIEKKPELVFTDVTTIADLVKNLPDGKGRTGEKNPIHLTFNKQDMYFYGNGRVMTFDKTMRNWEKKNGKIYLDGNELGLTDTKTDKTPAKKTETKETTTPKILLLPKNKNQPTDISVDLASEKNGTYKFKYGEKGEWRYDNSKDYLGNVLERHYKDAIDTIEDNTYAFSSIFVKEDIDSQYTGPQINKMKAHFKRTEYYNKEAYISFKDVGITMVDGKRFLTFDYDDDGLGDGVFHKRSLPLEEVTNTDGTLNKKAFLTAVRKDLVFAVLPYVK